MPSSRVALWLILAQVALCSQRLGAQPPAVEEPAPAPAATPAQPPQLIQAEPDTFYLIDKEEEIDGGNS